MREKLVITVHGIRTFGQWQERLGSLLKQAAPHRVAVENYHYGYFSTIAFLIPVLRWLATRRFRRELLRIAHHYSGRDISIVAHSFGTHLVGYGLRSIPKSERPRIDNVILAGSVLRTDFPWGGLLGDGSVKRVINDCGIEDSVLLLSEILVLLTGMAGRLGFTGMTGNGLINRYFRGGHSHYFLRSGKPNDNFMALYWVPVLVQDKRPVWVDERVNKESLQGSIITLLYLANPIKFVAYFSTVIALFFLSQQWLVQERANAVVANIGSSGGELVDRTEAEALWRLSASSYQVKRQVLLTLISQPGLAVRFLNRPDYIVQAAVGLNVKTRDRLAGDVFAKCRSTSWSSFDSTEEACLVLLEHLDKGSQQTVRWMIHLTESMTDSAAPSKLGAAISSTAQKVADENAVPLLSEIIHSIAESADFTRMQVIGAAVSGLAQSPSLSSTTLRTMFTQTLRAIVEIGKPEGRAVLGPGLRELAIRLDDDNARAASTQLLSVMHHTQDSTTLVSCWEALAAVSDRQDEGGRRAAMAELVAVFRIVQNPQLLAPMGQMLAKYGKLIPKDELRETLARQAEVMNQVSSAEHGSYSETSVYLISAMAVGLGKLAEVNPSVARRAYSRMNDIAATDVDPTSLAFLSDGIMSLAGSLDPKYARSEFERAVAEIRRNPTAFKNLILGHALTALGGRLTVVDARELAPLLLADLDQMDREGRMRGDSEYSTPLWTLSQGLSAVAKKIGSADPQEAIRVLLSAFRETRNEVALLGLSACLKEIAGQLSQAELRLLCEELLDQMGAAENESDCLAVKPQLEGLMTRFNESEARRAFEILLHWRERIKPTVVLWFGAELAQISVRAGDTYARAVFGQLMTNSSRITTDTERRNWVDQLTIAEQGMGGQTSKEFHQELELLSRLPSAPCQILAPLIDDQNVPQILEVLKWPTCNPAGRDVLIERVGKREGQTFGQNYAGTFKGDVWSLVSWARRRGLDVDSPPERLRN